MYSTAIVIPILNEAPNIAGLVERLNRVLTQLPDNCCVLFVDNNSTDGSTDEIKRFLSSKIKIYQNPVNQGLAQAVLQGIEQVDADIIVVMDGDFSHPPEAIPRLLEELTQKNQDMVIGSRYCEGGTTVAWPLHRKIASRLAAVPARLFTDVKDPLSGFFAVKKKYLKVEDHNIRGFKLGFSILTANHKTFKVSEVPIAFKDRTAGSSKMNLHVIHDYYKQLFQLFGGDPCFACDRKLLIALFGAIGLDFLLSFQLVKGIATVGTTHLIGFFVASFTFFVVTEWWLAPSFNRNISSFPTRLVRFCLISFFVVALRGGVISFIYFVTGKSLVFSLATAIVASHFFNYWGNLLFVYRNSNLSGKTTVNWRIIAFVVCVYFLVLRLLFIGSFELLEEEAYYWNYAQHMDYGFIDHPPMVAVLIWLGTALFGDVEFGVRVGVFFCSLLTLWFVYRLSLLAFNRTVAFCSLLLVSLFPFYYGTGLLMTPDAPLTACWAATVYFLYRTLVREEPVYWLGVGISLGLGMGSKYTLVLLGPAIILYMLLDARARKWFFKPHAYLTVLLALAIFSPVILWNYNHEWASFLFQSKTRVDAERIFTTHKLTGSVLLLITPVSVLVFFHFLFRGKTTLQYSAVSLENKRKYWFFLFMTVVPLAVFTFFSLTREVKFNWTGPLWVALIPYFSLVLVLSARYSCRDRFIQVLQKIYPPTLLVFAMALAVFPNYLSLGLPGLPYIHSIYLAGWKDLAVQVEEKVDQIQMQTGKRPLVVGMDLYQVASSLAFYRNLYREERGQDSDVPAIAETASWTVFGFRGLMYGMWFDDESFKGKDLLMVSRKKSYIELPYFQYKGIPGCCSDVEEVVVSRNQVPLGKYYFRYLPGYILTENGKK